MVLGIDVVPEILRVRRRVAGGDWLLAVDGAMEDVGDEWFDARFLKIDVRYRRYDEGSWEKNRL